MQFSRYRNLTEKQLENLRSKAKKGDPSAVRGLIAYSVWKNINSNKGLNLESKAKLHNALMNSVIIKIKNGRAKA